MKKTDGGRELSSPHLIKHPSLLLNESSIKILDQNLLPHKIRYLKISNVKEAAKTINNMSIRGAPLIGVFAALVIGLEYKKGRDYIAAAKLLKNTRPTAFNLFYAIDRVLKSSNPWKEALLILKEEEENSFKIAEHGERLIRDGANIITYCNTGNLAAPGIGTALGVIINAWNKGKKIHVYVPETRPRMQGARLTAFELKNAGIPFTLITDNSLGMVIPKVDMAVTGADRIASNGDTANKIGTFLLALSCQYYKKPFYVAAPSTTFDVSKRKGKDIEIEKRGEKEVVEIAGKRIPPLSTPVLNFAFDLTPGKLIKCFITEKGLIKPPYSKSIKKILS